jgi:flagellar hook-associated protein 3 FlgL
MIERITELMSTQQTLSNISNDLDNLTTTESELSSGLKINQPSDDPFGASEAIQLNSQLSALSNYSSNISDGNGWLGAAGGALTDINNMTQTVRQLVVEGANGTDSATDDANAADEVNQLIDSIKQAANTTYNNNYIFSGSALSTAPYTAGSDDSYAGNSGAITRTIGPGSAVQVNTNISSLLGNGTSANDGGLLDTLRTISSDLTSGNTSALGSTDLTNLDANLSTLEGMQANVGALTNRLTDASSQIATMQSTDQSELASTVDANMATTATTYQTEQTSYSAALQAGAQIVQESLLNFLSPGA